MAEDMGYRHNFDFMDEKLFPRSSIYLAKENPNKYLSNPITRVDRSDEDIIKAVSEDMAGTLGAELEP
jgi:hypothetical protein